MAERTRATMQHVAALAGVSLKTVSRVVNGEPGVSEELEARVRDAVQRLGYRHNLAASNLRRGRRTASIGVLVQDLRNDFSGELLRAVEDIARLRGVVVMSSSLDEEPQREVELVRGLVERRIDGLILMPATEDQSYLLPEVHAGLAVVVVDRPPRGISLDSVTADNAAGVAAGVDHLAAHGHRRVAFVGDDTHIPTAADRRAGYLSAVARLGLDDEPELRVTGARTPQDAERAVAALLALDRPPTAIMAARNVITIAAVRALRAASLSHQIALVGFDDFPTADLLEPGVTLIKQDVVGLGTRAMDILLGRMDGEAGVGWRNEVLPTTLVERGSGEIPGPAARRH
ncbi:MAG: LacI family DNA-binding transcriptional regulator [Nocardioides sp.]